MRLLLDTSVFVSVLRGHPPAVQFLDSLRGDPEVMFSALTEAEILAGASCRDPAKRALAIDFLAEFEKVEIDNAIARRAGDLIRDYGLEVGDALIAATAVVRGAEVRSRNVKHFERVPGISLKRAP